ncbi:ABC transporter permease [Nakamurella endophytica]|nr:ABC transporter permease [Nakamurella endophytica]
MTLTYAAMSARATFRNARFVLFTVALPLALYLLFNGLYGGRGDEAGITVGAYLMVSMAAYGGIGAAINAGARIAVERQTGWNRQLRLSALTPRGYMAAKSAVSLLVALPAILLVFLAGALVGHVRMPLHLWLGGGLAVWLSLIPFAVVGLVIGFVATVDSTQSLTVLVYMAMAVLGGLWIPVEQLSPFLQHLARAVPSYWTAQIARDVLAGVALPLRGIGVLLAWTVVLAALGAVAYRRSGRKA